MNQVNLVGIDVSAKELAIKMEKDGSQSQATFENEQSGHKKLLKYITKRCKKVLVCMEATGVYHFQLALYLSNAKKVKVMVINPKVIKHFSVALMQRGKTDPLDANVILEYLKRMGFKQWEPPGKIQLKIQAITRRMHQLKAEINRERNRYHADGYKNSDNTINNDIKANINHLGKRIDLLEKKGIALVKSDEKIKRDFDLLTSIKGIAQRSALQILSELNCLPADMQAEQWVAYAGLDPRVVESGTSIDKPRRITKAGNKYLRTALYMPAWVAVQHDSNVKDFFDKLIAKGKKPLQAIVAVMRKLLHAIWGMLHSGTQWDGKKFYDQAVTTENS